MKYNESDATARKIYVRLTLAGTPVTGFVPAAGELKLSLSGDAIVNGAGTWAEIGSGLYTYQCTQAETVTLSYLMLIIIAASIDTFCWVEDIGYRIAVDETSPLRLRIPIFLLGPSGVVTGASVSTETTISINGAALAAGSGTFGESGNGAYYYEAASSEVANVGTIVLQTVNAAVTYVYAQSVLDAAATSPTTGDGGYFGAYFGAGVGVPAVTPTPPAPVPAAVVVAAAETLDHAQAAIDRLPEYAKAKSP